MPFRQGRAARQASRVGLRRGYAGLTVKGVGSVQNRHSPGTWGEGTPYRVHASFADGDSKSTGAPVRCSKDRLTAVRPRVVR
jgi:hypothetical protein